MLRAGLRCALFVTLSAFVLPAAGVDINLAGFFGGRVVLIVDGGPPRTLAVGQTSPEGVRLVAFNASTKSAEIKHDGKVKTLRFGQAAVRTTAIGQPEANLTLFADPRGHHFTQGTINGASQRFIVDTGASMVSIGRSDAERARIDYRRGRQAQVQTASGPTDVWLVRLDTVKVGDITLHGVDALVFENDLPFALLGMSFLNRTDMQQQGNRLVLRKRF